jgi:hypothetical protein
MTLEGINHNHEPEESTPTVERTQFSNETIAQIQSALSQIATEETVATDTHED